MNNFGDNITKLLTYNIIAKYSILGQLPILILLIIFSLYAYRYFEEYKIEFKYLVLAWIANFLYMIFSVALNTKLIPLTDNNILFLTLIQKSLEYAYIFIFLIVGLRFEKFKNKYLYTFPLLILFFFVYIYIKYVFLSYDITFPSFWIAKIIFTLLASTSLILVSIFFRHLYNEITKSTGQKKKVNFLFIGTLIYAGVQLLILAEGTNYELIVNNSAFLITIFAKLLILWGLQRYFVFYAEISGIQKNYVEKLKNTLGETFHELLRPFTSMENYFLEFRNNDKHKLNYDAKTGELIDNIEKSFSIALAEFTSQKDFYERSLNFGPIFEIKDIAYDKIENYLRINTLIETSIKNLKILKILNENNSDVTIERNYGFNCNFKCYQEDIIKMISNLLKNSIDAFPGGVGTIYIKTYVEKQVKHDRNLNEVVVEIGDDGIGLRDDIRKNLFKAGKSTKGDGRGYGLHIVDQICSKYDGRIELVSPFCNNINSDHKGTNVIMRFPQVRNH